MDITQIPFNKYINIIQSPDNNNTLELGFGDNMKNHLGTFHAGAQFALAEACSGLVLQNQFSHLADKVVPVIRKTETKFKRPASSNIKAKAFISDEKRHKFEEQFVKKDRALISVPVEVVDENDTVTMVGTFEWFIQKIE